MSGRGVYHLAIIDATFQRRVRPRVVASNKYCTLAGHFSVDTVSGQQQRLGEMEIAGRCSAQALHTGFTRQNNNFL